MKKWLSQPRVKENLKILIICIGLVAFWRVGLEVLNSFVIPELHIATKAGGFMRWASWDGGWYKGIIQQGYYDLSGQQSSVAFFPGFPTLIYLLSFMGHVNPIIVGLVVNTLLTVGTCYFLYKITLFFASKFNAPHYSAIITIILFLVFPSSFFLASLYAESLLIFSLTAAIYLALTNRLLVAAIFAGIAASCKSLGLVGIPVVLLIDYSIHAKKIIDTGYLKSMIGKYVIVLILGLSLFISYLLFLYINYHDALAFIHVQSAWGRSNAQGTLQTLWSTYYAHTFDYAHFGDRYNYVVGMLEMYLPIVFFVLAIFLSLRYRVYWLLFMCLFMLYLPLSTGNINSMNRYVYGMTPIFVLSSIFISRLRPALRFTLITVYVVTAATLLSYVTLGFLTFNHFAG